MRRFLISAANIGPNRFHRYRTVSWHMSDAPFEQNVFNLAQRQRIADVHHHREANDLGRCLEVLERIFHSETLDGILPTLNAVSSDNVAGIAGLH